MSFLLLLYVYCILVAGVVSFPNHALSEYSVCETATCHQFAQSIRSNMNNSVDPCTDFYEYGCGLWETNNPIPPNQIQWSEFDKLNMQTLLRLKEILEEGSEYDDMLPIKLVKQFYRSCLDEDAIENQGLKPMEQILNATGECPMLMSKEQWEMQNRTWQKIDNIYGQQIFKNSFFKIELNSVYDNSSRYMVMIRQNTKYFSDEEVSERSTISAVKNINVMLRILLAFVKNKELNIPKQKLHKDFFDLILFKENLQNISEEKNEESEIMTIAEFQEYYDLAETQTYTSNIDWLFTIQNIFEPLNISIDATEPLLIFNKHFFHQLALLLDDTPPEILANYVQWNIIMQHIKYLNKEMRDLVFELYYSQYNVIEQEPRWKTCIKSIPMKDALSYLFVKKYTSANTLKTVTQMVEDVKMEMKTNILQSTWTKSTKDFMMRKMNNTISQIGYPQWYNNRTAFIKHYEGLEICDEYFKNMLIGNIYETRRRLLQLRGPVDRNEWLYPPITYSSFYIDTANAIFIIGSEIQYPFFTFGMPIAVNYAMIGTTAGHELAHNFQSDTLRIQYDEFGNKQNHTNQINQGYEEKAQCFINQYDNFTMDVTDKDGDVMQVDGEMTKDENIADAIGVQVAFAAFLKRKMLAGPQLRLPGLTNITDEQLYFISYVNKWCSSTKTSYEADTASQDAHSSPKFRIIGSLANTKSFSETFNCPINSPMNPESRCSMWK